MFGFMCLWKIKENGQYKLVDIGYSDNKDVYEVGATYEDYSKDFPKYLLRERIEDATSAGYNPFDGTKDKQVVVCLVEGSGDNYRKTECQNSYKINHNFSRVRIIHEYSEEELVDYGLTLTEEALKSFLSSYKLSGRGIARFMNKFGNQKDIMETIQAYQFGDPNVFERNRRAEEMQRQAHRMH